MKAGRDGAMPLWMLPGMLADGRMFAPQSRAFPGLRSLEWPAPRPGDSLRTYARRVARDLRIPHGSVLGGVSFGGMVAQEMASLVEPQVLILIGTATSPREIIWPLRTMAVATRPLPGFAIDILLRSSTVIPAAVLGVPPPIARIMRRMKEDCNPAFRRWVGHAMMDWRPSGLGGVRVCRIHGAEDGIIPPPADSRTVIVRGAGHYFSMTHPRAVNAFIQGALEEATPRQQEQS